MANTSPCHIPVLGNVPPIKIEILFLPYLYEEAGGGEGGHSNNNKYLSQEFNIVSFKNVHNNIQYILIVSQNLINNYFLAIKLKTIVA